MNTMSERSLLISTLLPVSPVKVFLKVKEVLSNPFVAVQLRLSNSSEVNRVLIRWDLSYNAQQAEQTFIMPNQIASLLIRLYPLRYIPFSYSKFLIKPLNGYLVKGGFSINATSCLNPYLCCNLFLFKLSLIQAVYSKVTHHSFCLIIQVEICEEIFIPLGRKESIPFQSKYLFRNFD